MMAVTKERLADIPGVYAIGTVTLDQREFYLAASENRGGMACLIDAKDHKVYKVWESPGGTMSLVEAVGENAFYSIDEFYPVFDSKTAKIMKTKCRIVDDALFTEKLKVCDLPYVHRIAQIKEEDGYYIIAGTLCSNKEFVEDWSTKGGVYVGRCETGTDIVAMRVIKEGITKQHAMYVKQNAKGYDDVYVGGSEGIFKCTNVNRQWRTECVLDIPTGDICVEDLDGDGEEELVIIEGFHGDKITIYKKFNSSYKKVKEISVTFGHVFWVGKICNEAAMIIGSRGGEKELTIHYISGNENGEIILKAQTIEKGAGPTQIHVCTRKNSTDIISSNHETGQVYLYSLEEINV